MPTTQTVNLTLPTPYVNRLLHLAGERGTSLSELLRARLGLVAGVCQACGCTDECGCPDGCSWSDDNENLCSRCAKFLEGRDQFGRLAP